MRSVRLVWIGDGREQKIQTKRDACQTSLLGSYDDAGRVPGETTKTTTTTTRSVSRRPEKIVATSRGARFHSAAVVCSSIDRVVAACVGGLFTSYREGTRAREVRRF